MTAQDFLAGEPIPNGTIAILKPRAFTLAATADWIAAQRERWPGQIHTVRPTGNQIARGRNMAVASMWGQWLLFVDNDCVPPPFALPQLLAHGPDSGIVGGYYHERPPSWALSGTVLDEHGVPRKMTESDLVPKDKLRPVHTLGTGCLLIWRHVLEHVETPWFRCGQIVPDMLDEDVDFCLRAAAAGHVTYVDPTVRVGHYVEGIAWPGADGRRYIEWPGSEPRIDA